MAGQKQRGSSFVSTLIALSVIVLTMTILIAGLATSARGALLVRNRVSAQNVALQQMEAIKEADWASSYALVPMPSIYTATVSVTPEAVGLQKIIIDVSGTTTSPPALLFSLEDYKVDR